MKLSKNDILSTYAKVISLANKKIVSQEYDESIRFLSVSAQIAYSFNYFYSDAGSEGMMRNISSSILSDKMPLTTLSEKYVFYDSFGWENRGLTQQYIRAFQELKVDFLFIYEKKDPVYSLKVDEDLHACGEHVTIYELDSTLSPTKQMRILYDVILEYAPSKAFLHIAPWSVIALSTFYAFPQIVKYNINLTDHAFWLGSGCIDYNIEFRNYGYTVSVEKRGLQPNQELLLPYYPIEASCEFLGFPNSIPEDSIKIFSGASFYKIFGENGLFLEMVKRILLENKNAVILFAGSGELKPITKFVEENNFEDRFFLLGHRTDINEVFKACDIYLGTYPFLGGLMSQYAAKNRKPILAYTSPDFSTNFVEGIVCHNRFEKITHIHLDDFFSYAKMLCSDVGFRKQEGQRMRDCVITPEKFTDVLNDILCKNRSFREMKTEVIDYERFSGLYLEVENNFQNSFKNLLVSVFKFKALVYFPNLSITLLCHILGSFKMYANRAFMYYFKR